MEYTEQDVTDHMGLVYKIAHSLRPEYTNSLLDFDDLVSEGTLGLIRALQTFDPDHGAKFSTWAWRRIQGSIQDAHRKLHRDHRRAKKLGIAPRRFLSLDSPASSATHAPDQGLETLLYDLLPNESVSEQEIISRIDAMKGWRDVWSRLSPTQQEVMGLMLSGLTQVEVAKVRKVTPTAVYFQYHRALAKARRHYELSDRREIA